MKTTLLATANILLLVLLLVPGSPLRAQGFPTPPQPEQAELPDDDPSVLHQVDRLRKELDRMNGTVQQLRRDVHELKQRSGDRGDGIRFTAGILEASFGPTGLTLKNRETGDTLTLDNKSLVISSRDQTQLTRIANGRVTLTHKGRHEVLEAPRAP